MIVSLGKKNGIINVLTNAKMVIKEIIIPENAKKFVDLIKY